MAIYNDPFSKAAAFWKKYYPKMKAEKTKQAFWDEVISMAKHFDKDETERKLFVLLVDELEKRSKENQKEV